MIDIKKLKRIDGPRAARWVEKILEKSGYTKSCFFEMAGLNRIRFYRWRDGQKPDLSSLICVQSAMEEIGVSVNP